MKNYFFIIFIMLCRLNANADYRYMSLSDLVCEADYGAIGTIVKIDNSYYYLKVEKYVLGNLDLDTLKIRKFTNWPCGQRYADYDIGQRELAFFKKSNYVIDDYDLLGYGGGAESEMPIRGDSIYYNITFGQLESFQLKSFLLALKDLDNFRLNSKKLNKPITQQQKNEFSAKSSLHKLFIECHIREYKQEYDIPKKGYIGNLEINHLYKDYENKIFISGFGLDTVFLSVEDAEVWKEENYFIVKPKDGWNRRFVNVFSIKDKSETNVLNSQVFEVLELPEPRLYFGSSVSDTVNLFRRMEAFPTVAHYLDDRHQDKFLNYELLSYTYTIKSDDKSEVFKIKSKFGNMDFIDRLKDLKNGDQLQVSDIYVLYPNKTVRRLKDRTVIVDNIER